MRKLLLICCMVAVSATSFGQARRIYTSGLRAPINLLQEEGEEEDGASGFEGVSFGLNVGSYFASRNTANFYNGACMYPTDELFGGVQCVTIAERLDPNVFINDYRNILNNINNSTSSQATAFSVPFDSYPLNMRYNPAMYVGFQMKYAWSRTSSMIFNLNAVRLRAVDQFTLQFFGTTVVDGQNDVRLFQIYGREQRFNLNLGYRQGFEMGDQSNFYVQFGGSMLGTSVQENQIRIAGNDYSLFMYTMNINQQVAYQARTNVGFGFYIAPGFEFIVNNKYGFDLGLILSRDRMNLNGYKQNGWNKMIAFGFNI